MMQIRTSLVKSHFFRFLSKKLQIPYQFPRMAYPGHQIELRMYEHHSYKADWEELDRLIEAA
jgi:hypothetical protein